MADFDSPFVASELRGCFRWDEALTHDLRLVDRWLYHACHEDALRRILRRGELKLRSNVEAEVYGEVVSRRGLFLTPQAWHRMRLENHFGPFVIQIPMSELEGRRFYVFKRRNLGQ